MDRIVIVVCLGAIAFAGCGGNPNGLPAANKTKLPPGCFIEDRDQPKLPEEKVVARKILAAAKRPKTVHFLRWGPHDLKGQWITKLLSRKDVFGNSIHLRALRVVWEERAWEGTVKHLDHLFISNDKEDWSPSGLAGDRWFGEIPYDD